VVDKPTETPGDKGGNGTQDTEVIEVQEENYSAKILTIIKDLNKGDGANIKDIIKERDIILIKGSQSQRMEIVVKALMAEPHKAKDMLVRQTGRWD